MRVQNFPGFIANRWVIFSALAGAILLAAIFCVISCFARGMQYRRNVAALELEIAKAAKQQVDLESAKKQLDLDDKKLSMILDELLSACRKSGVLLGETTIAEPAERETCRSLPVSITVKGTYNQIGKFISLVEKNPRFQIFEVNLSTKETKGVGIVGDLRAEFIFL